MSRLERLSERVRGAQRRHVFAVVMVLLLVGVPVAAWGGALFTSGSTFGTDSGLEVKVQEDQTFSSNPFTDAYTFDGDGGSVSATGTGDGYLEVDSWGSGSGSTVVQNLELANTSAVVDPVDSDRLEVAGTASEVSWNDVTVDDGNADFSTVVNSGEQASVTVYGVSGGDAYQIVDGSGNVIDRSTAAGDGTVQFDIESSATLRVQSFDNDLPTVTDLGPDGEIVGGDTITLNATVDDDTLPASNVTVTYRVDGDQVHTTDVSSAGTVSYTLSGSELPGAGTTGWSITATDEFGSETTESATFSVPGNITVRNVSDTNETIANADVTIHTDTGEVERQSDSNGNVSLDGLPGDEVLVFEVNATDYHQRTTAMPSVIQAEDIYLIPENDSTVFNRFTVTDATGEFGSDATVYLEKSIEQNGSTGFRTVAGDKVGVEGASVRLAQGDRYRIRLVSEDGNVAQMGKYDAELEEEIPLRPESLTVELGDGDILGYAANVTDGEIRIQYLDPMNETDVLTVSVRNRFNESDYLLEEQTYYGTNSLTLSEPIEGDSLQDSYIAILEGQRDGERFEITVPLGPDQISILPGGLDTVWIQIPGIGLILLVGGTFSRLNVGAGVVVTSLLGGVLWFTGFLSGVATWASVALAITFGVVYAMVVAR